MCRLDYIDGRSLVAEQIMETLLKNCMYPGCEVKKIEIREHEKDCGFRHVIVRCAITGCDFVIKTFYVTWRADFEDHGKTCEFKLVPCTNRGCDVKISRKNVAHKTECEFQKVKCSNYGCKAVITKKEKVSHSITCDFCKYPGCFVKKSEIKDHEEKCMFKWPIKCRNPECLQMVMILDYPQHLKTCQIECESRRMVQCKMSSYSIPCRT